jgi:hypothetical protein
VQVVVVPGGPAALEAHLAAADTQPVGEVRLE